MRSLKLMVATAVLAAFVAGPVLAQSADSGAAACATGQHMSKKSHKCVADHKAATTKKHVKKHAAAKAATPAAPAVDSAPVTPAQ